MDGRKRLFLDSPIYDHESTEALFLNVMSKNVGFHLAHNREYRNIAKAMRFRLSNLRTAEDLGRIPCIPTMFFKERRFWTLKSQQMLIKATSSGTAGRKSQMAYEAGSLLFGGGMALRLAAYHKLFSPIPANYVMLGYEPHPSNHTVITKTQRISSLFAPPLKKIYALEFKNGKYGLVWEHLEAALERYARSLFPVRLIGFPSYTFFFLRKLKAEGKAYRLPAGSMALLGGGWKEFYKEKADKEELYRLFESVLGIGEENCREFFGAAEHPALYCDCKNHHFHVPASSRVLIRDVRTLEPVGYEKQGLLNLLTPLAKSMPLSSVMTDDIAVLHRGSTCGCGIRAPYFEIIGRAGMETIRTCAADASKLLPLEGEDNT